MYQQDLVKVLTDYVKPKVLARNNRYKKWEYGYNEEHDFIVISKTGEIGEVYEIQNLKIALPKPQKIYKRSDKKEDQYWEVFELNKDLQRIKTIFHWKEYPSEFKEKWFEYIDEEFKRREEGFWFYNNGNPTYITGTHYMYLQWSKIDVGKPDFRESNRLFYIFWEACKADDRCYGMCYLKNRRSGFSFMASGEVVNLATISSDSRYGILSKTGPDAKKMFTDKVVPISVNYPFFFKPIQDGMDRPKTELAYRVPASKLTRRKIEQGGSETDLQGLDTTIDWKNTGDNSYDGEKLKLLVHDESGKWERPNNILNNWRVTKTTLRLGSRIVGKCMMGSTSNALDKGGDNFKNLYYESDVTKRNRNGQTSSGLYSLFIPMEWNYEGYIDTYGIPVFETPTKKTFGPDKYEIKIGVIDYWDNEVEGLKNDQDSLNEFYRQFPRTTKHAFRDETKQSLFNLTKIYEQIDYNEEVKMSGLITQGSFQWKNGVKDTSVEFIPNKNGRFKISWIPQTNLQNKVIIKNGIKYPVNEHIGAFGCDSYDISGTVDRLGSNGALHGVTKFSMEDVPANRIFLEYVARPQTAEIFFEDVLMALVFYSMPILCENNKPRLLYYLRRRGYRGFSMNRPDKTWNKLSITEKEIGGIPNSSEDIKQAHAAAIESYIENYVGQMGDNYGDMYFQRTLEDWAKFDINNRTKYDACISSGLAIMACNKNLYRPVKERTTKKIDLGIKKYNNRGVRSQII
jgi:phage anti-repressor protein